MEDYKQRYEELVEKLNKARIEKGGYTFSSVLDDVAPELKENYDEEIKKMLIKIVNITPATIAINNRVSLIDWIERHSDTKDSNWTKEDEGMLNCIIATFCEDEHGGREINDRFIRWLQLRKPSNMCDNCRLKKSIKNWRPSKGQLDAMEWEIKNTSEGSWQRTAMEKLYEDLKKL